MRVKVNYKQEQIVSKFNDVTEERIRIEYKEACFIDDDDAFGVNKTKTRELKEWRK